MTKRKFLKSFFIAETVAIIDFQKKLYSILLKKCQKVLRSNFKTLILQTSIRHKRKKKKYENEKKTKQRNFKTST